MAGYQQGFYGQQGGYQAFTPTGYINPQPQPIAPLQTVSAANMMPQQNQNTPTIPGYAARAVMCREEAVAAEVLDGRTWLFIDEQHGSVYKKRYNPFTNQIEFEDYCKPVQQQPQQPQFVPWDAFQQFQQDIDQRFTALQPQRRTTSKTDGGEAK